MSEVGDCMSYHYKNFTATRDQDRCKVCGAKKDLNIYCFTSEREIVQESGILCNKCYGIWKSKNFRWFMVY